MWKCFLALLLMLSFGFCKNKNAPANEDAKSGTINVIDSFATATLPYSISDTNLNNAIDADTISYKAFTQIVPDTIFSKDFNIKKKLSVRPLGKFGDPSGDTYLLFAASNSSKSAVYVAVLNKSQSFSAFLPLLTANNLEGVVTSATVDQKLGITINKGWKNDETEYYQRNTYAYNNAGVFSLILNETNDVSQKQPSEINPLDTFPKKNKFSGDYEKNKDNFIALRDGKNPQNYRFYIHFENNDAEKCTGELRGELNLTSPSTGVFRQNGDPCVIDFSFVNNKVKVKEQGSCGNYRGIKCFFNDTYVKKKEIKKKARTKQ